MRGRARVGRRGRERRSEEKGREWIKMREGWGSEFGWRGRGERNKERRGEGKGRIEGRNEERERREC